MKNIFIFISYYNIKRKHNMEAYLQRFTMETLLKGLADNKFKNIVIFTGPGIGVPDFKSNECLSYICKEVLFKFNLPKP